MKYWNINKNTDTVDIDDNSIGLDVRRLDTPNSTHIYDDRGLHIQIKHNKNALTYDFSNHLADLIVAAPDLLEALEIIVDECTDLSFEHLCLAKNALRKANQE